jgi:hypothetical protein
MAAMTKSGGKGPRRRERWRLLLIACSQKKTRTRGAVPAIERYDGPAFRVLRRYLRDADDQFLTVCILSARFGVIAARKRIPDYDQKMTSPRALQLRETASTKLRAILRRQPYREVLVCAGRAYLTALAEPRKFGVPVRVAARGQGKKLRSLKNWLRENAP